MNMQKDNLVLKSGTLIFKILFAQIHIRITLSSAECYNVLTPFCQVSRKLSSKFEALKQVRKLHIERLKSTANHAILSKYT